MRIRISMLMASALLAGCGMYSSQQTFSAPGPCGALARQRLDDVRMAGLAAGYEKAIFDYTHRECLSQRANQSSPAAATLP